jgi:hypothetical protein
MNLKLRDRLSQFSSLFQRELLPLIEGDVGESLTAPLRQLLRIWEMVQIEHFVPPSRGFVGRPPRERAAVARAFLAKTVLNIPTTAALVERLQVDRTLRQLCGFDLRRKLPGEHLFSRAFKEFSAQGLASQAHEALVKSQWSDQLIGHIARDSTAIEAREKPLKPEQKAASPVSRYKRGRPRKGEVRPPPPPTRLERQAAGMSLSAMLAELPRACDVGSKLNAQGFLVSWKGYKLHLDVADGQVPVSAIVTSASVHDSQVAIPLATMSAERVQSLYDVMDSAYCSPLIRAHSRSLGHVPLIDHNPRKGEKIEFAPHEAKRFNIRTQVERVNARLKDEFGASFVRVRGHAKVTTHLMLGVLVLTADQLLRLLT